jgi:hypothetical protein
LASVRAQQLTAPGQFDFWGSNFWSRGILQTSNWQLSKTFGSEARLAQFKSPPPSIGLVPDYPGEVDGVDELPEALSMTSRTTFRRWQRRRRLPLAVLDSAWLPTP